MKLSLLVVLVASVSAIKIADPKVVAAAAKPAPLTFNYQSTGGHPSVNRLPNAPKTPVVAPFRLGGDAPVGRRTGTLSEPQKGQGAVNHYAPENNE